MAYDGRVLRQATLRFDEDKQRRQEQQRQRQQQVYQQCPELESIQREIRGTMGEIIASALRRGTDPLPAIRVIRDKNLSLQRRRAELLAQLGYPEDYLSEKPRCPLCGDTGYRGDGLCSCLKKYYAQEQIRELSRMLDIGSQSFDTFELDWYSPDRGSLPRSPRENAQRNLNLCRDFAARFRPGRENLLLFGAPGLGKTFLSACIARVVSEDGFSVVYHQLRSERPLSAPQRPPAGGEEHRHQHQSGPGGVGPPLWSAAAVPSGGGVPAAALCGDGYPPPEA